MPLPFIVISLITSNKGLKEGLLFLVRLGIGFGAFRYNSNNNKDKLYLKGAIRPRLFAVLANKRLGLTWTWNIRHLKRTRLNKRPY